eukprot:GEMP01059975.1.p1 GENE.GEMP01059975.1~~GEMP01059975.1.p1  ORF type:complete len:379 (+),score=61.42 GEMP01059975.1:287-1423(+)
MYWRLMVRLLQNTGNFIFAALCAVNSHSEEVEKDIAHEWRRLSKDTEELFRILMSQEAGACSYDLRLPMELLAGTLAPVSHTEFPLIWGDGPVWAVRRYIGAMVQVLVQPGMLVWSQIDLLSLTLYHSNRMSSPGYKLLVAPPSRNESGPPIFGEFQPLRELRRRPNVTVVVVFTKPRTSYPVLPPNSMVITTFANATSLGAATVWRRFPLYDVDTIAETYVNGSFVVVEEPPEGSVPPFVGNIIPPFRRPRRAHPVNSRQLRRDSISSLDVPEVDSSRYLVYHCSPTGFCGGHGDRINGIIGLFVLSLSTPLATNRRFAIESPRPVPLSLLWEPKNFDWRMIGTFLRGIPDFFVNITMSCLAAWHLSMRSWKAMRTS